jgi:hypothetical protein
MPYSRKTALGGTRVSPKRQEVIEMTKKIMCISYS